jgi:hypothetical protein
MGPKIYELRDSRYPIRGGGILSSHMTTASARSWFRIYIVKLTPTDDRYAAPCLFSVPTTKNHSKSFSNG